MENKNGTYKFVLPVELAEELDCIYSKKLPIIAKRQDVNKLCTYILRSVTIIKYLNNKHLHKPYYYKEKEAFDFYEILLLINNLMCNIDGLYKLLGLSNEKEYKEVLTSKSVFLKDHYTDHQYIKYLRSACVIHPDFTSTADLEHNKNIIETNLQTANYCYCVRWVKDNLSMIRAYNNAEPTVVRLDIESFEKFAIKYIKLLPRIIKAIRNL